ncbi:Repetin, partial [Spheniscus magellanicus]
MSRFLDSVSTIISVFHKHAKEDGDCSNFSRRKMKEFIQREFADVIAKPHDPQTIDKILQFLEWDGDGEIDFNEFLLLVFRVAKACYWYLPKGPSLLQRTTLTTSGKSLREPDFKNRGSRRQLQEEEQQTCEKRGIDEKRKNQEHELECPESERDIHEGQECKEQDDTRRKEAIQKRRIDRQRELDLEVYERRSRQTREREERGATTNQGEACERRDCQTREPEDDGRRQREPVRYERTRETAVAAAEADVKVHRVSRELEPCEDVERRDRRRECEEPEDERRVCRGREREEPVRERRIDRQRELDLEVYERRSRQTREREERGATTNQGEACERRDCQTREPEDDGRRQRESVRYERTRETAVAAAEADVKVHRVSRELEPCEDVERRDRRRECEEPEDERRVCRGREREEPVRERRIDRQRELDLEVYERRSRQTREREERGATTNQGEACERRDCQTREPEDDGRRQRESVRYERTRETAVAAAEADVKVHRVSRELEPCEDVERRDRRRECEEPEDERRVCRGRERE